MTSTQIGLISHPRCEFPFLSVVSQLPGGANKDMKLLLQQDSQISIYDKGCCAVRRNLVPRYSTSFSLVTIPTLMSTGLSICHTISVVLQPRPCVIADFEYERRRQILPRHTIDLEKFVRLLFPKDLLAAPTGTTKRLLYRYYVRINPQKPWPLKRLQLDISCEW